jgi:hypothetical protein
MGRPIPPIVTIGRLECKRSVRWDENSPLHRPRQATRPTWAGEAAARWTLPESGRRSLEPPRVGQMVGGFIDLL